MFTIILLLYLQLHLEVTLESSSLRGVYATRAECETAAARLRGPLPTPRAYDAAWHDAVCLPINREVKVNELAPQGIGDLFKNQPRRDAGPRAPGAAWPSCARLARRARDLTNGDPSDGSS